MERHLPDPHLPNVIGPSPKLRDTVRLLNERLPITYEAAKRQVDRIQKIANPHLRAAAPDQRKIGF